MSRDDESAELNRYLEEGLDSVRGWCNPRIWQAIWPLSRKIGAGPVAEIGVYEGKFFIGLVKTFGGDEAGPHLPMDIFDMQELNVDRSGSGKGRKKIFEENLEEHGVRGSSVSITERDSLDLRLLDAHTLVETHGRFKFFSIDGGHEVTHTMHDIEIAMQMTDSSGIISVDDYLNPDWPGVNEAVAKMYLNRNFSFVPLLYIGNKLLLCTYSHHSSYLECVRKYITENYDDAKIKDVTRFGYRTLSIKPSADRKVYATK